MKIEKLTENKIRVIIHSEELGLDHTNLHSIMTKALQTQEIFSAILKKAEKEVDFCTDGCKLLIEAISSLEDVFVFTITKYSPENDSKKKRLIAKRKSFQPLKESAIYQFDNFDIFCDFCNAVHHLHKIDYKKLSKSMTLYLWHDTYYLVLKNVNTQYNYSSLFFSNLSEFGKMISSTPGFEAKLLEHGKMIIKRNAVEVGIEFFAKH